MDMHIEVGSTAELVPRDTLVMASDGLFDNLHLEEIAEYTKQGIATSSCSKTRQRLSQAHDRCQKRSTVETR